MASFREIGAAAAVLACTASLLAPAIDGASVAFAAGEEVTCVGDSCQSLPPEPEDPTPGTLVPNPGNPPLHFSEPKKPRKHRSGRSKNHRGGKHEHGQARQPTR
jgi:hypothetical protein